MDITTIDKNFKQQEVTNFNSNIYTFPNDNFTLLGGFYDNEFGFIKMPDKVAKSISSGVNWGSKCGAGIRLLFSTDSDKIKVSGITFDKCIMYHMAFVGSACFTLCEVENGQEKLVCNLCPNMVKEDVNFVAEGTLKGKKLRNYILYFPLYSGIKRLTIELANGSIVKPYNKYQNIKPILYYGSSITQGGCASRATNCYQTFVSEWLNIDYYVLGFSGNAKGEPEMANYLKDFDCSIFVCDYDYNALTVEDLKKTHLPLYKAFRSGKNKNTPIIFISKPDGYRNPQQGRARFNVIKATFDYAKSNGDNNVYLIDGSKIYPKYIREHCAVDGCHPTDLGFYFMAKKVYKMIKTIIK